MAACSYGMLSAREELELVRESVSGPESAEFVRSLSREGPDDSSKSDHLERCRALAASTHDRSSGFTSNGERKKAW